MTEPLEDAPVAEEAAETVEGDPQGDAEAEAATATEDTAG